MKVKYRSWTTGERIVSVGDYVENELTYTFNDGLSEQADEKANKTARALGRLINVLADKRILDLTDIAKIVESGDNLEEVE